MLRPVRFVLGCCLLLSAFGGTACGGRWRPQQAGDVAGLSDPNATYTLTLQTLKSRKYGVLSQDAATRTVTVRAHNGEGDAENVNVITLHVDAAAVHVSAKGYLVHRDGSTHRSLNAELSGLHQGMQAK